MCASLPKVVLATAAFVALAQPAAAQGVERLAPSLLEAVMPAADRFDPVAGDPPVKRAYRGDELVGYVFLTSDVPPEVVGYDGPIRTLVGMTTEGVITGVRPVDYRESRRYEWGDFLNDPWLLGQFVGKSVSDRFSVNRDIDGIAQVTISVRALTRGVRDAARRVAVAYAGRAEEERRALAETELVQLSWFDLRERGIAATLPLRQQGREPLDVSVIHLSAEQLGPHLIGLRYQALTDQIAQRGGADEVLLYAVEGNTFAPPLRDGWSIVQGADTVVIPRERVVTIGSPGGGILVGESSQVGALLLDRDRVDVAEPMDILFDRGRPDLGVAHATYVSEAAVARAAALLAARRQAETPPVADTVGAEPAGVAPGVADPGPAAAPPAASAADATEPEASAPTVTPVPSQAPVSFAFETDEEGRSYGELFDSVAWSRVAWIVFVLLLAALAFFRKTAVTRWASLGATLVILGWLDGGFLSISHVTGVMRVGASAILGDVPLLLMVTFTLVALLVWGRVFCGFLCPFGALQDVIDRLVPARFKRELPRGAHRIALKAKYVVLAVVLLPAIAGLPISLYQYVEPFGTVFFLSGSLTLWAIAVPILVAAAIVPRFYCRYACPLGAALAVGSLVSLRRIRRVEQCDYCKVCEQRCPTGAIEGPKVDFKECVRCNECEVMLRDRRGVCGHPMEEFRPRLVQIHARAGVGGGR